MVTSGNYRKLPTIDAAKWGRQCVYCGKKDITLEVEHIHPKSSGGSNRVSNLTVACRCCNQKKGDKSIEEFLKKKQYLLASIVKQAKTPLLDATAVNATRWKLFQTLNVLLRVQTGTGGMTKMNRVKAGLPKDHWIDAACVGVMPSQPILKTCQPLIINHDETQKTPVVYAGDLCKAGTFKYRHIIIRR
ncbi:HNH endonuclease [Microseira sp. BLCC-F43]|uniref:HNH endonuclease n=1 Tax=Microseira sp. BLCC-F43 TaxID=3153602 RepID=UPI0035BA2C69